MINCQYFSAVLRSDTKQKPEITITENNSSTTQLEFDFAKGYGWKLNPTTIH